MGEDAFTWTNPGIHNKWEGKDMDKRFGFVLAAILVFTALVPMAVLSAPTRATTVSLDGISIDGVVGTGGEYASGLHMVTVTLVEELGEGDDYSGHPEFTVKVFYDCFNSTI